MTAKHLWSSLCVQRGRRRKTGWALPSISWRTGTRGSILRAELDVEGHTGFGGENTSEDKKGRSRRSAKCPSVIAKQAGSQHVQHLSAFHFAPLPLVFPMGDAPGFVTCKLQELVTAQQVLQEPSITISIPERKDEPPKTPVNPLRMLA